MPSQLFQANDALISDVSSATTENEVLSHKHGENGHPKRRIDRWYFPEELKYDLAALDLPEHMIAETLACAWEYVRSVIPQFTNRDRYIAFVRTIVIAVVTEFRGDLISMDTGDKILGYDVGELLDALWGVGTPAREAMSREFWAFVLISSEKSSKRINSDLFRRYTSALASSPKTWFRLRDGDALCRFTMAGALVCNDMDAWFSEDEWQLFCELGDVMYDAVAYYKHRAEGETNNTFAYVGGQLRAEIFRLYREVLWAADVAWAQDPVKRCVLNFIRLFGGAIHMTCRRYRFVEDGLMIGKPDTEDVVAQVRDNFKLWHRVEAIKSTDEGRYAEILARSEEIMFPALADALSAENSCPHCSHEAAPDVQRIGKFGGVRLCGGCQEEWRLYIQSFPVRFTNVFRDVSVQDSVLHRGLV